MAANGDLTISEVMLSLMDDEDVSAAIKLLMQRDEGRVSARTPAAAPSITEQQAANELEQGRLNGDLRWGSIWSFAQSEVTRTYEKRQLWANAC